MQLVDTTGLDLALGYAVWCHYDPDDDRLIDDYVHETGIAVLPIPEQGGLARTGNGIRVVGPRRACLFDSHTAKSLQPDDVIPQRA